MAIYYFYAGTLDDKTGEAHMSYYPHMVREGDTPAEACQKVIDTFASEGIWPNAVIGPTGRSVTLNPGNSHLMTLTIGKSPK